VICDAGSKDGTWDLLTSYEKNGSIPLRAMVEPRCRPARGRNLAVAVASHDVLAVTDVGCDWDDQWLEELAAPFESTPGLEAVMGSWTVRWEDQESAWAKADYALQNGLELRATPQSHSANRAIAYRKDFYLRIGGLPEDLTFAADDMTFALLIQKCGSMLAAAPIPRCYWFRPQARRALLKEARRNFLGNGEAGIGLKHFVLVGGRMLLELAAFIWLPVAILGKFSLLTVVASTAICVILLALRVSKWSARAKRFSVNGQEVSVVHLAVLDYLSRWYGLVGYVRGLITGYSKCRQCRARLRAAGIGWS